MKKRFLTFDFAAVLLATGLFAGCGTGPNYVVDSTGVETAEKPEATSADLSTTPETSEKPEATPADPSATPENAASQTSKKETKYERSPLGELERFALGDQLGFALPSKSLFNGKSLDGWANEDGYAPRKGWRVKDGLLSLTTPGEGGDLITQSAFKNFVLDFEFRFGKECNSGVKYKITHPDGKSWVGLEYQIQDDANVEDGKIADRKIASLFDVLAASDLSKGFAAPTDATPTGDFHKGRIVVLFNNVEHWLDGEKVLEFEIGSDAWNAAKEDSKYKNQKEFGEVEMSRILLQDHGYPIDFRNIKIRELSAVRRYNAPTFEH